jgi:LDH2 family malate/lactate/ureidoglycolate dehydrogenase
MRLTAPGVSESLSADEPEIPMNSTITVTADRARAFMAELFVAAGVEVEAATLVAGCLVEADLQGVGSHGLLQAPNYVRRLRAGTIRGHAELRLVRSSGAIRVYDAGLALGHAVARQAMEGAMEVARATGISAVAIRSATHFGMAGQHAAVAAHAGLIGIAMCNSRVMLPAPGGTRPVVGNNPLAIAVPAAGRPPIVFDMAMSAAAMGKIRLAAQRGEPIPADWALDSAGQPTTDAAAAIGGMLQPAAGAKGFGLALMVDLLCALADGSNGQEVGSMYGEPATPADCSWLLIAIDPSHFGLRDDYAARVAHLSGAIAADGAAGGSLPGDRKIAAARLADGAISLPLRLVEELDALAAEIGAPNRLGSPA